MDYEFSQEDKARIAGLGKLFSSESPDLPATTSSGDPRQNRSKILEWQGRLAASGYFESGVRDGLNSVSLAAAMESVAQRVPSLFLAVEMSIRILGRLLASVGGPRALEILEGLLRGDIIGAVAGPGCELTAERTPQGLTLTGAAAQVLNGPFADWCAVPVRLDDQEYVCLVAGEDPGVTRGTNLRLSGFTGLAVCDLAFGGCAVPWELVLGPFQDDAVPPLGRWEDEVLAVAALGVMHRCLEFATTEARSRERGGKPLIAHQEIAFGLAEMLTLLDSSTLLVYRAAWLAETGSFEAPTVAHCARAFSADAARQVADLALGVVGLVGQLEGNPVEVGLGDARYLQVAGTPVEEALLRIGEALLG